MCGRYTLSVDKSTIEKRFGGKFYIATANYHWAPTYNTAPSHMLPVMRTNKPDVIELGRWGFYPEEWGHSKRSHPQINARLESAAEKPMFRSSFESRHCLVIADGDYEWKVTGKTVSRIA